MKRVGYILLSVGLAFLVFALYTYIRGERTFVSPIPEAGGVKVIYITPGAEAKK